MEAPFNKTVVLFIIEWSGKYALVHHVIRLVKHITWSGSRSLVKDLLLRRFIGVTLNCTPYLEPKIPREEGIYNFLIHVCCISQEKVAVVIIPSNWLRLCAVIHKGMLDWFWQRWTDSGHVIIQMLKIKSTEKSKTDFIMTNDLFFKSKNIIIFSKVQ